MKTWNVALSSARSVWVGVVIGLGVLCGHVYAQSYTQSSPTRATQASNGSAVLGNSNAGMTGGPAITTAQSPWWKNSIWQNNERGRLWYPPDRDVDPEDTPAEPVPPPIEPRALERPAPSPAPSKATSTATVPEIAQMKAIKEKMEELRVIAVVNPTPQNVKNYIRYQEEQMDRSALFADVWRRVIWDSPELDYSQRGGRPTMATAIRSFDDSRSDKVRGSIASLAQTHGLYFFYRGDCPFCHALAPILKQFEQIHGIRVIAISIDGGKLPEFPRFVNDNGQSANLGVRSVPAIYLAVPGSRSVTPIGTGVMSLVEIEERIYVQAFTKPGQEF